MSIDPISEYAAFYVTEEWGQVVVLALACSRNFPESLGGGMVFALIGLSAIHQTSAISQR